MTSIRAIQHTASRKKLFGGADQMLIRYQFIIGDCDCSMVLLLLLITMMPMPTSAQLILDRRVDCTSQNMAVTFDFAHPFDGIVFAQNYYQFGHCRWHGDGTRRLIVPVPLTSTTPSSNQSTNSSIFTNNNNSDSIACGVQLHQSSGEFSVLLVVSPIRDLLVDGVVGLHVRCAYYVSDLTITLAAGTNGSRAIHISPQTQNGGVVTGSGGTPFLQMSIRDGHGIAGDIVSSASVGQRVALDIVMQDTAIYDFYVHSCYAHDGSNSPDASINIIDANGCAVRLARAVDEPVMVSAPVGDGGPKHAYVNMYGFQFTTSQFVYFECQQCEPKLRSRRQSLTNRTEDDVQNTYRLQTVLQMRPQQKTSNKAMQGALSSVTGNNQLCTQPWIIAIVFVLLVLILAASVLSIICIFRRMTQTSATQSNHHVDYYTPTSTPSCHDVVYINDSMNHRHHSSSCSSR